MTVVSFIHLTSAFAHFYSHNFHYYHCIIKNTKNSILCHFSSPSPLTIESWLTLISMRWFFSFLFIASFYDSFWYQAHLKIEHRRCWENHWTSFFSSTPSKSSSFLSISSIQPSSFSRRQINLVHSILLWFHSQRLMVEDFSDDSIGKKHTNFLLLRKLALIILFSFIARGEIFPLYNVLGI